MQIIHLPAECDSKAIKQLMPELDTAIAAGAVTVDASATRRIGQTLLQLLLSARETARFHGVALDISGSAALDDAARLTGLSTALFGEPRS
jgi:anti-anti-sigma regulatory factor